MDKSGTGPTVEPEKNMVAGLGKLPEFRDERIAVQRTVESRGYILVLSPECHWEVAGIEI